MKHAESPHLGHWYLVEGVGAESRITVEAGSLGHSTLERVLEKIQYADRGAITPLSWVPDDTAERETPKLVEDYKQREHLYLSSLFNPPWLVGLYYFVEFTTSEPNYAQRDIDLRGGKARTAQEMRGDPEHLGLALALIEWETKKSVEPEWIRPGATAETRSRLWWDMPGEDGPEDTP